jgi:hypothetical protein
MSMAAWVLNTLERCLVDEKRKPICKSLDAAIELALDDKGITDPNGMTFSPEGTCTVSLVSASDGIVQDKLLGDEELFFVAPFTTNKGGVLIVMQSADSGNHYVIDTESENDKVNFATIISTFASVCAGEPRVVKAMKLFKDKLNEEFAESFDEVTAKAMKMPEEPPKQRSHPEWATW